MMKSKLYRKGLNIVLFVILAFSTVFGITGCGPKQPEPYKPPVVVVETVTKPVKPPRPDVKCEFTGDGITPSIKLTECLVLLKKALESVTVAPDKK